MTYPPPSPNDCLRPGEVGVGERQVVGRSERGKGRIDRAGWVTGIFGTWSWRVGKERDGAGGDFAHRRDREDEAEAVGWRKIDPHPTTIRTREDTRRRKGSRSGWGCGNRGKRNEKGNDTIW